MEIQVTFSNHGAVGVGEPCGVEYLVGIRFLELLAYLLSLCNEDTGPVTPALIFWGVTFCELLELVSLHFNRVRNHRIFTWHVLRKFGNMVGTLRYRK
ncbi:hypothetical protein Hanom_Chr04g00317951 [Helianthus anomalus]